MSFLFKINNYLVGGVNRPNRPSTPYSSPSALDKDYVNQLLNDNETTGFNIRVMTVNEFNRYGKQKPCIFVEPMRYLQGYKDTVVVALNPDLKIIKSGAFEDTLVKGELELPEGLVEIGNNAFKGCTELTGDLILPDGLVKIGDYAFAGCTGLTGDLILHEGLAEIGNNAFEGCTGLKGRLELPYGLAEIGDDAFKECTELMNDKVLDLPKGLIKIGKRVFSNFHIKGRLSLPNSLQKIGSHAFEGCTKLNETLTLPEGLVEIGDAAFKGCTGLTGNLNLPEGLIKIGDYAFAGCKGFTGDLRLPSNAMFHPSKIEANKTAITTFMNSRENPTPWDGENVENVEEHKCYDRAGKIICFHRTLDKDKSKWVKRTRRNPIIDLTIIGQRQEDAGKVTLARALRDYGKKPARLIAGNLKPELIRTIAAGRNHSLFLAEGGGVLSCGSGEVGVLGHGDRGNQLVPKRVAALVGRRYVHVAAGLYHSLFLTEDGDALSCGSNRRGQLGHGDEENQDVPKLIEGFKDLNVVQVAAGRMHSLFLTEGGKVFSCGWGEHGQLGHGDRKNQDVPKLIEGLKERNVVQVAAGYDYSLFVTQDGKVLSCGWGAHGQLGHDLQDINDEEYLLTPKLIEGLKERKVVQVAAGSEHSLFLTGGGKVYSCGWGGYGRMGHGDEENQDVPKLIEGFKDLNVVQVAAGSEHSLFVTEGGKVFSCGWGEHGQLGHGYEDDAELVPKLITSLKDIKIVQVAAGGYHSLFLTEGGAVLSCGSGSEGQLGGHRHYQGVPKLVDGLEGKHFIQYERVFVHQDSEMVEHDVSTLEAADAFIRDHVIDTSWLSSIGDSAFYNCSNLTGELKLPKGLTEIGNQAFDGCTHFNGELTLPKGLIKIGNDAFAECTGLTGDLILPKSLKKIGGGAFYRCTKLTGMLELPKELTYIGGGTFYECKQLRGGLVLPEGLTKIGEGAFYRCTELTGELVLPEGLVEIDRYAFAECTGLTGVIVARRRKALTIRVGVFSVTSVREILHVEDQIPYRHSDLYEAKTK